MSGVLVAPVIASAVGANKWHVGLLCPAGAKYALDVVGVQVNPTDGAAVTGTGAGFLLKRISTLGSGNSPVALRKLDKLTTDPPTTIGAQANLTTPAVEANPELASIAVNTEETAVAASGPSLWPPIGLEGEPVTLNAGDGVGVQQGALASAGNVDVYIYFRVRKAR
jgi:hypothetical protein